MAGRMLEPTPLVGRRHELDAIKRLLEKSRLVTLTGVGGTGKTRLARRVAADLSRAFVDGTFFVELADVEDPSLLGLTLARTLGLQVGSGEWRTSLLTGFLAERRVLLILDNCEHLADACAALIDEVLSACPTVRILATSQRALGSAAEAIYQVPPLSLPADEPTSDAAGLRQFEAIELFVERASALHPSFELTATNAASVAELCRALEGIPLTIELAASRIRVLSPQAMLDRLHDRYQLLNHGFGGRVPDRQRSLEASVQWTYDLCSDSEQRLWTILSVFRGGMALEAVEELARRIGLPDAIDALSGLVERSVLTREDDGATVRFRMLETIRLYGERQLVAAGDALQVRELHRDLFIAMTEQFHQEWMGPNQVEWLARMRDDHHNLRAALQFSLDRNEPDRVMQGVAWLEGYWITRGLVSEARRWLDRTLEPGSRAVVDPSLRLFALRVATWFALVQVDMVAAAAFAEEAEWGSRTVSDPALRAHVLMGRGLVVAWEGDAERGMDLLRQSIDLHRQVGNVIDVAFGLVVCGMLLGFSGDISRAREVQQEVVDLCAEHDELYMRSFALGMLGLLALDAGEAGQAVELLRVSLEIKRRLDDRLGMALVLEFFAGTAALQGEGDRAATLLGAADSVWKRIGVSLDALPFFSIRRSEWTALVEQLLSADRRAEAVLRGGQLDLSTAVAFALGEEAAREPARQPKKRADSPLTRRESEVALLVADGLTNQEIADRLVISTRTAEAHVENILKKLGFTTRRSVATWVADHRT